MATTSPIIIPVKTPGLSQLQKMEMKMKALEKTVEQLNKDLLKNATATKAVGKAAGTATGNIQRMGIAFRTTLAPIVAVYGAFNFLNRSLQVASQRQVNVAKLANGLKNLGGTAADLEKLADAADKFGRATLFDQEDAERAYSFLTSFQRIGVDSYTRVTEAAADLATVTGQDLNGAMTQLAKALEDPARRVTDLARSGTVFTEQQKEQIKTLQESGRLFEAQNLILKEIEKQYGGAAEAAGSAGLAGALDTLGEATRDFQEQLVSGTGAINMAEEAIRLLASAIDAATQKVREIQTLFTALDTLIRNLNINAQGLAGVFDMINQAIIKSIPGLEGMIFAYEQLLKLAGKYNDSQAGTRNFGSNYASQEKALFEQAGGYTPYKPTGGGGGKGSSADADKAAREAQKMADQLLKAQQLVTAAERREAVLQTTDETQKAIVESENKIFEIAEKYGELAAKSMSDAETENLLKAQGLEIQNERVALEERLADIEKQRFSGIDDEIAHMEAILAGTEEEYLLRKKIAELGGGPEAEAKVMRLDALTKEVEAVKALEQQYQSLASGIAGEMTSAFSSIIDGSKSAEEAMADMFKGIAQKFLDMAMQILQDALTQQLMSLFGSLFGGALSGGIGSNGVPGLEPNSYYGTGGRYGSFKPFAEGGYVTGPTQAMIGEAGEPEYAIPQSKMVSAMERYSSGMRGEAVTAGASEYGSTDEGEMGSGSGNAPINVNYSGPIMRMDNSDYVKTSELPGIINQSAKAGEARALGRLRSSVGVRRKLGMS